MIHYSVSFPSRINSLGVSCLSVPVRSSLFQTSMQPPDPAVSNTALLHDKVAQCNVADDGSLVSLLVFNCMDQLWGDAWGEICALIKAPRLSSLVGCCGRGRGLNFVIFNILVSVLAGSVRTIKGSQVGDL